jgi:hypothetical protein
MQDFKSNSKTNIQLLEPSLQLSSPQAIIKTISIKSDVSLEDGLGYPDDMTSIAHNKRGMQVGIAFIIMSS